MIYPSLVHEYKNISFGHMREIAVTDSDKRQMSVMQFTGLSDKNGKEIYEGDVVSRFNDTQRSLVEFVDGAFCSMIQLSGGHDPQYEMLCNDLNVTEVIGNIFQNPDLL